MNKFAYFIIAGFIIILYVSSFILEMTFLKTIIYLFVYMLLAAIIWLYWSRNIYFYRDPERNPPLRENVIVSPADGTVMYIYRIRDGKVISNKNGEKIEIIEILKTECAKKRGWLVGIYISPFDVHYNYAPIDGEIKYVHHHQTDYNLPMLDLWEYIHINVFKRFMNLFARQFHFVNERMTIQISSQKHTCFLILIADKFVNKITPFFKKGEELNMGQKISFITRGSQADIFIPEEKINFEIEKGQQVYGCETIIAEYKTHE